MPDLITAYQQAQRDVVSDLRSVPEEMLSRIVPACPGWTIKDLLAHVVHVSEKYAFGLAPYDTIGIESFATIRHDWTALDAWTEEGVVRRKQRSLEELINEWDDHTYGPLLRMMNNEQPLPPDQTSEMLSWVCVGDLAVHTQDFRGATGGEPNRDSYAVKLSYASYAQTLTMRAEGADVPPLRVVTQRGVHELGNGEPERTLEADWFEFLRTITGRRSVAQITELFGAIDVEPYLGVISNGYPIAACSLSV